MYIPSSFTLGAIEWQVKKVHNLGDALGKCDFDDAVIYIQYNDNRQLMEQTYCHELIHAFYYAMGRYEEDDEVLIDNQATFLHQYLTEVY